MFKICFIGIGVIAFFYGHENRPRPPGIAISNHLSANDIMVIASDIERGQRFLYTVTGQQHSGVIGFIQSLVSVGSKLI
jgi:1-acyl-sn-glycerol-3-phosphate acyltransferase